MVRGAMDTGAAVAIVRRAVAEVEPALPVEMASLHERFQGLTAPSRFNSWLLGGFAATGLVLAAVGIYGVIAFLVSLRAREVGVRMALGARPAAITRLFVAHAARWTLLGLALGVAASLITTRFLGALLYNVRPGDGWSFAAAAAVLSATALASAWLPSRRAARMDPVRVLRED